MPPRHLTSAAPHERPARARRAARRGGPLRVTELMALDRRSRGRPSTPSPTTCVRLGWVEEVAADGRRARAAGALARVPRRRRATSFGVDIGEVKVRTAVADLRGAIVAERVREFAGDDGCRSSAARHRGDARRRGDHARASCCSRASAAPGAMDTPRGRVLFSSVFEDDFDLAGSMARTLGRPAGDRERLQPRGDRRALVRRGARARRRRLRARRRADRRRDHGRRQADARARGRGGRARVPRRLRGGARRPRHRPARSRALRRGARGRLHRRRRRRRGGAGRSSSAPSAGPATGSSRRRRSSTPRSS